jgi:hypothetical protein
VVGVDVGSIGGGGGSGGGGAGVMRSNAGDGRSTVGGNVRRSAGGGGGSSSINGGRVGQMLLTLLKDFSEGGERGGERLHHAGRNLTLKRRFSLEVRHLLRVLDADVHRLPTGCSRQRAVVVQGPRRLERPLMTRGSNAEDGGVGGVVLGSRDWVGTMKADADAVLLAVAESVTMRCDVVEVRLLSCAVLMNTCGDERRDVVEPERHKEPVGGMRTSEVHEGGRQTMLIQCEKTGVESMDAVRVREGIHNRGRSTRGGHAGNALVFYI